ncbi:TonB-dependent receptor plug domain-containing protein [Massilia sp. PWRC2]|uniref:TonB-dependent receptor plug domain-containing protein n=1 Tax=Massilia sp. PWRC2 TaxID=2804626 RepID=UPI003CEA99CE
MHPDPCFPPRLLSSLLYWLPACALAQQVAAPPAPAAASVDIVATRDRARQLDTAAMTVIGRDELQRFGDQSVADALRRVPGITVSAVAGRGGEIRMRGLGNGYTRMLLNGQPAPNGFAIDSISPEQIERVEVLRVATAETGAQAIAGTINIILRKGAARTEGEWKGALALSHDRLAPDVAGQFSATGASWQAALGVVAVDARSSVISTDDDSGSDASGAVDLRRRTGVRTDAHRPTLNLTPRLAWTLSNGDTLTSQNFLRFLDLHNANASSERTTLGAPTSFPDNRALFRANAVTLRHDLVWLHQMAQGARLEVQLGLSHFQRGAVNVFNGDAVLASDSVTRVVNSSALENSWTLTGKWTLGRNQANERDGRDAPNDGHAVVVGWDSGMGKRRETRQEDDSAAPAAAPEMSTARLDRLALYLQDDWTVTPTLALSLGARYEVFDIASGGSMVDGASRRLHAGGPLLQARLATSPHGQLRLGVTRTFKLPTLTNLAMRRYTIDNNNSPLTPDEQGNPALLPERAWGLDLAYEHYFAKNVMASASLYGRRIADVIIDQIGLLGQRWISTPANAGRADAGGIELEAKTVLLGMELRANAARNWSRVARLPAPDNHLPNQAPFSAGIGVDRRFEGVPLSVGVNLAIQGGARTGQSERVSVDSGSGRDLSVTAVWRVDARSSWRLAAANLLAARHQESARYRDGLAGLTTLTSKPAWASIRLAYEIKL